MFCMNVNACAYVMEEKVQSYLDCLTANLKFLKHPFPITSTFK